MIAIIDYRMGNLRSVENALTRCGAEYVVTSDPDVIKAADKVILPGVGNAGEAMQNLREFGLDKLIPTLRKPVLGICVGMQVMCRYTEEGDAKCMGLFDVDVRKFEASPELKVPHMGWNSVEFSKPRNPLFKELGEQPYFYFVHSYHCVPEDQSIITAVAEYGEKLTAAVAKDNIMATQFHPEKSGDVGLQVLKNFIEL